MLGVDRQCPNSAEKTDFDAALRASLSILRDILANPFILHYWSKMGGHLSL